MYKVYLINAQGTDDYKIGVTRKSIQSRIKGLSSGNPYKLVEIAHYETELGYKLEKALHNYFKGLGKDSKEWFEFIDFDKDVFLDICKKLNENLMYLKKNNSLCNDWKC